MIIIAAIIFPELLAKGLMCFHNKEFHAPNPDAWRYHSVHNRLDCVRAVAMHLKMTAARHAVNFIDHGNYDKNTGLRDIQFRVQ